MKQEKYYEAKLAEMTDEQLDQLRLSDEFKDVVLSAISEYEEKGINALSISTALLFILLHMAPHELDFDEIVSKANQITDIITGGETDEFEKMMEQVEEAGLKRNYPPEGKTKFNLRKE